MGTPERRDCCGVLPGESLKKTMVYQSCKTLPISRAAHLIPYVECLRQIGVPVERELERFRLPANLTEKLDLYVPVLPALHFLRQMARKQGIEELELLGISLMNVTQLSAAFLGQAQHAPTLHAMLQVFFKLAVLEDPTVRFWLDYEAEVVRVYSSNNIPSETQGLEFSEWVETMAGVSIVREFAGAQWCPAEIAFCSPISPGRLAHEQFPNTRFLVGQPCRWFSVPRTLLSLPARSVPPHRLSCPKQGVATKEFTSFSGSLKQLMKAYLSEGYPDIRLAAEIAGLSVRTLQRRLNDKGLNYSTLIHQARLEAAMHLLREPHMKVIDVAYEVGYDDPSNFARSFRALTGLSPSEFRHHAVK